MHITDDALHIMPLYGFYSIYYYNKSDITITTIIFYKNSSYVDNKGENIKIYAYQNQINYSIPIRLYYI